MEAKLTPGLRAYDGIGEEPFVAFEEPDHLPVLLERVDVTRQRLGCRLCLCGGSDDHDHQGTQAQQQGFQTRPPEKGTGARRAGSAPVVSLDGRTVAGSADVIRVRVRFLTKP